jgi:uncharacterized membrane protein
VLYLVALIAAIAMAVQDILGIILLMAATRNRGSLAGIMDSLQWLVGMTTTTISVSIFQGHSLYSKVIVVAFVSLANYFGTLWGEKLGSRFVKDRAVTNEQRITALEQYIANDNHS